MRRWAATLVIALLVTGSALADEDTKALTEAVNGVKTAIEKRERDEWWKQVLGPVAGGLVGFGSSMLTLLIVQLFKTWSKPVLQGIVDADRGGLVRVEHPAKPPATGVRVARHVRLKVRNTGKETAKNCRVMLVGIQKRAGNNWTDLAYHDAVELVWAYGWGEQKTVEKDIVRDIDYYVDVCSANSQNNHMDLSLAQVSPRYRDIVDPEGSYVFIMLVTAENARSSKVRMRVNWPKNVENITIE